MQSLQSDHSIALAKIIIEMFAPCLTREEEQREAFLMVVEAAKASIEHYEMMADRRMKRIKPSSN